MVFIIKEKDLIFIMTKKDILNELWENTESNQQFFENNTFSKVTDILINTLLEDKRITQSESNILKDGLLSIYLCILNFVDNCENIKVVP